MSKVIFKMQLLKSLVMHPFAVFEKGAFSAKKLFFLFSVDGCRIGTGHLKINWDTIRSIKYRNFKSSETIFNVFFRFRVRRTWQKRTFSVLAIPT